MNTNEFANISKEVFDVIEKYKSFLTLGECFFACEDYGASQTMFDAFSKKVFNSCQNSGLDIAEISKLYGIVPKKKTESKDAIVYVLHAALVTFLHSNVLRLVKDGSVLFLGCYNKQSASKLLSMYKNRVFSSMTGVRDMCAEVDLLRNSKESPLFLTNVATSGLHVDANKIVEAMASGRIAMDTKKTGDYIVAL